MNATITIVLEEIAELTATADFPDPTLPTWVDYDPRLTPWFEKHSTTLPELERAMQRASAALNGRLTATYEGNSVSAARWPVQRSCRIA